MTKINPGGTGTKQKGGGPLKKALARLRGGTAKPARKGADPLVNPKALERAGSGLKRKLAKGLFLLLFFLAAFVAGLAVSFPGQALSRFIEEKVNKEGPIRLVLSPMELSWTGLKVSSLKIYGKKPPQSGLLLSLQEVSIPFSPVMLIGLPVNAKLGRKGELEAKYYWFSHSVSLETHGVELGEIPAMATLSPLKARATLDLDGSLTLPAKGKSLEEGRLSGRVSDVLVEGAKAAGRDLPPIRIDKLELDLQLEKDFIVRQLTFSGDMTGNLTGKVKPNWIVFKQSNLNLELKLAINKSWLDEMGSLISFLVSAFLKDNRVNASITGTLEKPVIDNH